MSAKQRLAAELRSARAGPALFHSSRVSLLWPAKAEAAPQKEPEKACRSTERCQTFCRKESRLRSRARHAKRVLHTRVPYGSPPAADFPLPTAASAVP